MVEIVNKHDDNRTKNALKILDILKQNKDIDKDKDKDKDNDKDDGYGDGDDNTLNSA